MKDHGRVNNYQKQTQISKIAEWVNGESEHMINPSLNRKIDQLRVQINRHNYLYYVLSQPEISDETYDRLMNQLRILEETHPETVTLESPTQRVGNSPSQGFNAISHPLPLLSLANAFNNPDLIAWHKRASNLLNTDDFSLVCELKMDGLAVALTYKNGILIHGATRGDGFRGEDITQNLRTIHSIPLSLSRHISGTLEVRGEVYFPKSHFSKLNEQRIEAGLPPFSNPRNSAAGSLRQLDPKITATRPLDIFIYGLGYAESLPMPSNHWDAIEFIKDLGFKTNPYNEYCTDLSQVQKYYEKWMFQKERLDYDADGIVVKINQFSYQTTLGHVAREPRWAIAYKFPAIQGVTKLLDIGINVGRTGALNPYAVLSPVTIGGVIIKTASLHNEDYIRNKDIRIGDWVVVERAGEVIPQVVIPVVTRRTNTEYEFTMPTNCPSCDSITIRNSDESMYYCLNQQCSAQSLEKLKHFVSREAMDIEGIGSKLCENLFESGLVKRVSDIYKLSFFELKNLDHMADISAKKIIEAINDSKSKSLSRLIFGLGIIHVGLQAAESLSTHFMNLDRLAKSSESELLEIPGIGTTIAGSIIRYFAEIDNLRIVDSLKASGLNIRQSIDYTDMLPFSGLQFVLTGKLGKLTRAMAEAAIVSLGGQVSKNVTHKTNYLVSGSDPGSKFHTAVRFGTTIIHEEDFLDLIDRNRSN